MSRLANSLQSLADTLLRVVRRASCQRSGLAALKDSRARRCLAAGTCSRSGPSWGPGPDRRARQFALRRRQPGHRAEIVADEDGFEGHRRLGALVLEISAFRAAMTSRGGGLACRSGRAALRSIRRRRRGGP